MCPAKKRLDCLKIEGTVPNCRRAVTGKFSAGNGRNSRPASADGIGPKWGWDAVRRLETFDSYRRDGIWLVLMVLIDVPVNPLAATQTELGVHETRTEFATFSGPEQPQ